MNNISQKTKEIRPQPVATFLDKYWNSSVVSAQSVIDDVSEAFLFLDDEFRVVAANETFYRIFLDEPKNVDGVSVFKLGNGQWNIPTLKTLLTNVLRDKTYFKGYEMNHDFPHIGQRSMILNARQIYIQDEKMSTYVLFAMEDVTEMMLVAKTLAEHTKGIEIRLTDELDQLDNINGMRKSGSK